MARSLSAGAFALAVAAVLLAEPLAGQRVGPSPGPSVGGSTTGGNSGGGRTGTGSTSNTNTNTNTNTSPSPAPPPSQPIYITGRVMTEDGSELPQNIAIERVCGNIAHIQGYADPKGYFSVQVGSRGSDTLQDASTSGFDGFGTLGAGGGASALNQQQLAGCELRASAPGYQSQRVELATHERFDSPDIGTILLHRNSAAEGTTVSATTLAAPKKARTAFRKGLELEAKKGKLDQARIRFQQAVDFYPKYAEAWCELGRVQGAQQQFDAARHSFDQAIRADPSYVLPYLRISSLDLAAHRWQELADVTDKAARLDPFNFPQAFFFNAVANYNLHREEVAEKSARRAEKLDTRHRFPEVSHLLGVILAGRRDYAGAAAEMRDYLRLAPDAKDAPAVRSQLEALDKQLASAAQPQP